MNDKLNQSAGNLVRLFGMTGLQIDSSMRAVQAEIGEDLGFSDPESSDERDEIFYPQFIQSVRAEAKAMARHYEIFYCLEKSIRALVKAKLLETKGTDWWSLAVPQEVRTEAEKARTREIEGGFTPRSSELLDYTTFGDLSKTIGANWDVFDDTFNSQRAVERIMFTLNMLRGPIAHCASLAEDEVSRLHITVRAWFRLME